VKKEILQKKANYVLKKLNKLYPNPEVPLKHEDPYTLLISVLLSAQCTDKRVNEVTPHLWKLGKDPLSMSNRSAKEIEAIVKPCGLGPQKSKAIVELSKILIKKYNGEVPQSFEELEELPGVGHKTASVVMIQAFGKPAFPVDTHIHRLAKRWGLSRAKNVQETERDLKALFPESTWGTLHLQIIYYGREHCSARGCDGTQCVICTHLNA
jgi:endonuclease-3